MTDSDLTLEAWETLAKEHPVASRLLPWAKRLVDASRVSRSCGLETQAVLLERRVAARLAEISAQQVVGAGNVELEARWNADGLPSAPVPERQTRLWRRVRSMRAERMPFRGEGHPGFQGLAWGPYNRQSAVAELLSAAAKIDPLWVDDFLERERAMRTIDRLLGLPG